MASIHPKHLSRLVADGLDIQSIKALPARVISGSRITSLATGHLILTATPSNAPIQFVKTPPLAEEKASKTVCIAVSSFVAIHFSKGNSNVATIVQMRGHILDKEMRVRLKQKTEPGFLRLNE